MFNKKIDFSKISFFSFLAYYIPIIATYVFCFWMIQKAFRFQEDLLYGVFSCLIIQVISTISKIFFLNKDWNSPVTIQYIIFGVTFFLNGITLYFLTLLPHNVIAILGFFTTYFLHLKVIIFLGYKLSV